MTDVSAYLDELAATLASHNSNLVALRMDALAEKIAPSMPPAPKPPVVTMGGDVSLAGVLGAYPAALLYGDMSDGDVTISGDTTLTRDMFYNNLTVAAGKRLSSNCFRIFVRGTLVNNGYISNNGNAAGILYPGATLDSNTVGGGTRGGDGGGGGGGNSLAADGSFGGEGGHGGVASYAGGSAGLAFCAASSGTLRELSAAVRGVLQDGKLAMGGTGGGGGGGGSGTPSGVGGGGGGGAGVLSVIARDIDNTNGVFEANGGAGAQGGAGAAGGGGGGGGGVVVLVYGVAITGVARALGGPPGPANGFGAAGLVGGTGTVIGVTL
jgi:hypothetical protein